MEGPGQKNNTAAGEALVPAQIFRYLSAGGLMAFILKTVWFLPVSFYLVCLALAVLSWFLYQQNKKSIKSSSTIRRIIWLILGIIIVWGRLSLLPIPVSPLLNDGFKSKEVKVVVKDIVGNVDKTIRYRTETEQGFQAIILSRPYPTFRVGDWLLVRCRQWNLARINFSGERYVECLWPELKFLNRQDNGWRGALLGLRQSFKQRIDGILAEPYSSLLTGMLWGDDRGLNRAMINSFKQTGTTHLLAVSGYNVMILTMIVFWLFLSLGLYQRTANFLTCFIITGFVLFTGALPATVRAGIMAAVVLLARSWRRRPDRWNLLLGTAVIMLWFQPKLISDLGWQLSFAAMTGLMFVAPLWRERLYFIPEKLGLRAVASETLAATFTTLPLILLRLDQLYLVSPLANLLIGPTVAGVFVLGLPLLPAAYLSNLLSWPIAWLARLILTYIILVVKFLANLPMFSLNGGWLTWLMVGLLYFGLALWLKLIPLKYVKKKMA